MVQVKLSNHILSIRGRCGGVYFKKDGPVQHIQAMPRIVHYQRVGLQLFYTRQYSGAAIWWLMALLGFYAAYWAGFAAIWLFTDKEGRQKKISGYCWYIHYTMTFPETDEPHFWAPPHSPYDLPEFVVSSGTTWHLELTPPDWPDTFPGGYYWYDGEYNGKPEYKTDDRKWWLWWKDPCWVVSWGLGIELPNSTYYSAGPAIKDYYRNPTTGKYCHVYGGNRETS